MHRQGKVQKLGGCFSFSLPTSFFQTLVCRYCPSHLLLRLEFTNFFVEINIRLNIFCSKHNLIITLKGRWIPSFLRRVGAQAPAVMTSCFPLNIALLVTTVTTGPGVISVTMWLSSSTPPFFLYSCYTVGGNQEVTK